MNEHLILRNYNIADRPKYVTRESRKGYVEIGKALMLLREDKAISIHKNDFNRNKSTSLRKVIKEEFNKTLRAVQKDDFWYLWLK